MIIKANEVLADVRSAAWLEQELHTDADRHRRHQMADICEEGNIEHVWRVLGVAVAEVRFGLSKLMQPEKYISHDNDLQRPDVWRFRFLFRLPAPTASYLREKIHEYLVARVMAERTAVIIPEASGIWQLRAEEALASLRLLAATTGPSLASVRRPLWPY